MSEEEIGFWAKRDIEQREYIRKLDARFLQGKISWQRWQEIKASAIEVRSYILDKLYALNED